MTKPILVCVDCMHYHRSWLMKFNSEPARCKHSHNQKVNLVTGKVPKIHYLELLTCRDARDELNYGSGRCGPEGQHWEERLDCVGYL